MATKIKIDIISEVKDQVLCIIHLGLLTEGKTGHMIGVQQGRKQDNPQDY